MVQDKPIFLIVNYYKMRYSLVLINLIMIYSCVKPTEYSDVPALEFAGFSKQTLNQGAFAEDSVIMVLHFTDGDGDFGTEANKAESNIFVKDLRTNSTLREYKAPFVPLEGAGNGISGKISILLFSTCCIFPKDTGIPPCEKSKDYPTNDLSLEIYIKDRAGNKSNTITTPALLLNCK